MCSSAVAPSQRLVLLLFIAAYSGALQVCAHRTLGGNPSKVNALGSHSEQTLADAYASHWAEAQRQEVKPHAQELLNAPQVNHKVPGFGAYDSSAADSWPVVQPDPLENQTMSFKDLLMNIGGGTGASISGTGDTMMDQELLRRMRYQDKAVMLLLLLAYTGSLLFSASIAYRQAMNESPVVYYADPRLHNLTMETEDVESFLEIFNQPPGDAQLQVTGLVPLPPLPDYVVDAAVMWLGARYRIAFSFALDLSPWLVRCGDDGNTDEGESGWAAGVPHEDIERLRQYLEQDTNDLSFVEMQKEVEWKDWEELATNIKSQIRQGGFNGLISVRRNCEEVVGVHKNKVWANFMHSRTNKVLLALSVLGWFVYQPYMWLRHHSITVRCKYRVDIGIGQFWPLIAGKIGPDGFNSGIATPMRANSGRGFVQQR